MPPFFLFLLAAALAAAGVDDSPRLQPEVDWAASEQAPAYAEATAHDPRFADRALWPGLSGREPCVAQAWPKGRLLVWARPGQSGSVGGKGRGELLDSTDPANWLEDGKPATALWDEGCDLLLPAAETAYVVNLRDCKQQTYRHLTIGRNARLAGGGDGIGRQIAGNVWIKRGGETANQGATVFIGRVHGFFRNDNGDGRKLKTDRDPPFSQPKQLKGTAGVSQYFAFNRPGGGVEFLGQVWVGDEFMGNAGEIAVGVDSIVQPGRACRPYLRADCRLVLRDGAYWGKWMNDMGRPCLTVEGGAISGGTPEIPLRRDCYLALAHKNHTKASCTAALAEELKKNADAGYGRVPGLVLAAGSSLRSHPASGSTARLTLTFAGRGAGITYVRQAPGSAIDAEVLKKQPAMAERNAWFDALPLGIDCWIAQGVPVEGVCFDHLRAGGLLLEDPAGRGQLKDCAFGPACLAQGEALFSVVPKLAKGAGY